MTIRVVVVDDSVVIRRLVVQALESDPDVEVVGTAANGRLALAKIEQHAPDAVTMDIEMPELNGVEAVRELRARGFTMPIIMFSTLTERGATATLDALSAGASDYVAKPSRLGSISESLAAVADQLIPKIRALVPRSLVASPATASDVAAPRAAHTTTPTAGTAAQRPTPAVRTDARRHRVRAVVLGCSTGGPEALATVVRSIVEPLPVPVLVVQHMPAVFTRQLAQRLDRLGPSDVHEAEPGQALEAGGIYIAPGDTHLEIDGSAGRYRAHITHGDPVNFCRPSVDVLFRSAVAKVGAELLGVVLTGMGADGRAGAGAIASAGGTVVVQDEASSVVWGMPGATATAGFAHRILPIGEIGSTISSIVAARRSPVEAIR